MGFGIKSIKKGVKKLGKGIKKGVKKVGNFAGDVADWTKDIPGINAFTSQLALLDSPSKFADIWKNNILPQYAMGAAGAIGAGGLSGAMANLGLGGITGTPYGMSGASGSPIPIDEYGYPIATPEVLAQWGLGNKGDGMEDGEYEINKSPWSSVASFLGGNGGGALGAALGGLLGYTSSKDLKSTTKEELPAWQREHIQRGLGGARALYETGNIAKVAPLSSQTMAGISRATDPTAFAPYKAVSDYLQGELAGNGPASSYWKDVLGGKYLDGNPYLDSVIGKAQGDVQSRVQSQFASGGRLNSGAAQRALAESLGDLSNTMRYTDYNNERGRMGDAATSLSNYGLNAASGITNAQNGYLAANQGALQAGGMLDAYNQRVLDNPYEAIQRYMGLATGNFGQNTTQIQPQNKTLNTLAGIAGGAGLFGSGGLFG